MMPSISPRADHGRGAIVLAAYSPDPELFARQLRSLQDQSVADWECIISVDGERAPVATLVTDVVGDDARFRVIGDDTRRGFYLNFEAGLRSVAPDTAWVALCDQDDRWDREKLAVLLPSLAESSLVSGQARLVQYPTEELLGVTDRQDFSLPLTVLSNQFTGSLCVFDADILTTALPFPRVSTRVATHDHWIAVVAGAHRGTRVLTDVVQDYVQHDGNVYGDPSTLGGFHPLRSLRNVFDQAQRYEGSRTLAAIARMTFWTYVGWRQLLLDTLTSRMNPTPHDAALAVSAFSAHRRYRTLSRLLSSAAQRGQVPRRFAREYRTSWLCGTLVRGRSLVARAVADGRRLSG